MGEYDFRLKAQRPPKRKFTYCLDCGVKLPPERNRSFCSTCSDPDKQPAFWEKPLEHDSNYDRYVEQIAMNSRKAFGPPDKNTSGDCEDLPLLRK